jgi:hypothetical protein
MSHLFLSRNIVAGAHTGAGAAVTTTGPSQDALLLQGAQEAAREWGWSPAAVEAISPKIDYQRRQPQSAGLTLLEPAPFPLAPQGQQREGSSSSSSSVAAAVTSADPRPAGGGGGVEAAAGMVVSAPLSALLARLDSDLVAGRSRGTLDGGGGTLMGSPAASTAPPPTPQQQRECAPRDTSVHLGSP